jgi:hypothetical protein
VSPREEAATLRLLRRNHDLIRELRVNGAINVNGRALVELTRLQAETADMLELTGIGPAAEPEICWYWGDNKRCRRCNVKHDDAAKHPQCPSCGFARFSGGAP